MSSTSELRTDLTVLGRTPAPAPRASFVDDLEQRLTAIASGEETSERPLDIVPADQRLVRGRAGLSVAVALAVVLCTAGLAVVSSRDGRGGGTATVETASADGLAGDSTADAAITAGASRSAESPTATSTGKVWPPGATLTAPGSFNVDGTPSTTAGLLEAGGVPEAMAEPQPDPSPASLGLRGSGTPAYAFLEWDRYSGEDFVAYLVLRAASPDDPNWPDETGRTIMLMRIEDRDTTKYQAQGKVGTTPRFRIVAIGRDGRVVAASGVFQADVASGIEAPRDINAPPAPPTP